MKAVTSHAHSKLNKDLYVVLKQHENKLRSYFKTSNDLGSLSFKRGLMPKEWFILINSEKEGPYSLNDLKQDSRITPDTLIWKKGMPKWTAIRDVLELNELFQDEKPEDEGDEEVLADQPSNLGPYDMTLTIQGAPPHLFLWLIIAALIMLYVCYQLFTAR